MEGQSTACHREQSSTCFLSMIESCDCWKDTDHMFSRGLSEYRFEGDHSDRSRWEGLTAGAGVHPGEYGESIAKAE